MIGGEETTVSMEPEGSEVAESKAPGTEQAPEVDLKAQMDTLSAQVGTLVQQMKIEQGELHRERADRAKDLERFKEERKRERESTETFLGRMLKGQQVNSEEAEVITKEYQQERQRLDLEEELSHYKAKDEESETLAEIRREAEQITKEVSVMFGVEIPKDKLPDPAKFDTAAKYSLEVTKLAKELTKAQPPAEPSKDKPKDKGELASLNLSPGAVPKESPFLKRTAGENISEGVKDLRRKHGIEAQE